MMESEYWKSLSTEEKLQDTLRARDRTWKLYVTKFERVEELELRIEKAIEDAKSRDQADSIWSFVDDMARILR